MIPDELNAICDRCDNRDDCWYHGDLKFCEMCLEAKGVIDDNDDMEEAA